jgi:hypothetical protein
MAARLPAGRRNRCRGVDPLRGSIARTDFGSGTISKWSLAAIGLWTGLSLATSDALAKASPEADFNGDGYDDLVIAIPGFDLGSIADAGAFVVVPGGPEGLDPRNATQLWHRGVDGVPGVQARNEHWGSLLLTADFNGDGFADLAIGSPSATVGYDRDRGDVVILFGSRSGLVTRGAQQLTAPEDMGPALFGASMAIGFFTPDPLPDIAVGAPGANGGAGAVVVFRSAFLGAMTQEVTISPDAGENIGTEAFGMTLAGGAFNAIGVGPGLDDLAIGARRRGADGAPSAGAIYVVHGGDHPETGGLGFGPTTEIIGLDVVSTGLAADAALFPQMFLAGDIDDDGFDDLVVGVPTASVVADGGDLARAGAVLTLYGGADGFVMERNQTFIHSDVGLRNEVVAGEEFATAMAFADFDDDGFADLVVGTPLMDARGQADLGNVNFVYGTDHGLDISRRGTLDRTLAYQPARLPPSIGGERFGSSLGAGDFNRDGYDDLAIGLAGGTEAGGVENAGWLLLVRGSTQGMFTGASAAITEGNLTGIDWTANANDHLGFVVSGGVRACSLPPSLTSPVPEFQAC